MRKSLVGAILLLPLLLGSYLEMQLYGASSDTEHPHRPLDLSVEARSSADCDSATTVQLPLNEPVDPLKSIGWITPMKQEGYSLCWAAVTQMAIAYGSNTGVSQCAQANRSLGRSDCCPVTPDGPCDKTGWPQFAEWNFHAVRGMITEESELSHYLCKKRSPVLYTYNIRGGELQSHMLLLYGYTKTSMGILVFAIDPGSPDNTYDHITMPFSPWLRSKADFMSDGVAYGRPVDRDYMAICPEGLTVNGSCPFQP